MLSSAVILNRNVRQYVREFNSRAAKGIPDAKGGAEQKLAEVGEKSSLDQRQSAPGYPDQQVNIIKNK